MEKKYIKTFESFRNSKNTEPVNEELLGAIGKAVGAIFKKGKELINKAKGGKEVEAIYQKYLKMIQDQFASQAKVSLNIMASEKGAAKPVQNPATVIPKKESVDFKNSDKLFEADANTKLAVDTLKQKKAVLDQIVQKLKTSALKEMDAILKKFGGSAGNPKLDLLIQSKKDEFELAYLNAQITYLEQAGDTTMVTSIKKERDAIATKIEDELKQADTAVAVEYKVGDEVVYLLQGKTKENYDPKKKPEDQKEIVGVHKIAAIDGDNFTLEDEKGEPTIKKIGSEIISKVEVDPKDEYKVGDFVIHLKGTNGNKALIYKNTFDYKALSEEEKNNLEEGEAAKLVGVHKIEKIDGDKYFFKDKNGEEFTKIKSEIIGKSEEKVEEKPEEQEDLVKNLAELKEKYPESIEMIDKLSKLYLDPEKNKDKIAEIEKQLSEGQPGEETTEQ